jgi:hypothetical protein
MQSIALLSHGDDSRLAKALAAELRSLIDITKYQVWQKDGGTTAFDDRLAQVEKAISDAWAVLVLVGAHGVDADFENLAKGAIQQRIVDEGTGVGRLVVTLPGSPELPTALKPWVRVEMIDPLSTRTTAQKVLELLRIRSRWSDQLNMVSATSLIPDGPDKSAMVKNLGDVARLLADGKPLTLMISPYASVEGSDDGSCPSRVRQRLLEMITDDSLRGMLAPLEAAARVNALPPLLWQDHLATLCLLSGRTREEVSRAIEEAISEAEGDETGKAHGQFSAIGRFVATLKASNLPRSAGLPAVTLLTVCPGLRAERALIANACAFERAALMFGRSARPELHRMTYRPTPLQIARALGGEVAYMPDGEPCAAADDVEFVRLVKLFGSRDLDRGVPSGDLGQAYDLMAQLRQLLEDFVAAAGSGPYLVLGGGLGTPPVQAAHAVLLRTALEKPQRRPRLAIVPNCSASPDPLRRAEESGRLNRMIAVADSGLDRLQIVTGDPILFLEALGVAFGANPPHDAEAA